MRKAWMIAAMAGASMWALEAAAQEPQPAQAGPEIYAPDFFAAYVPQTALDMVRRIPGFQIDGGSDRRGFSGTAGNVLIDGERPSAKSQGIDDLLAQIPARNVERIELRREGAAGEAAGQSVVVNVVRRADATGASGRWRFDLERSESNRVTPGGSGSYTNRIGDIEFTLGGSREMEERPLSGYRLLRNGADALTGSRTDLTPRTFREAEGNIAVKAPLFGGRLNLNGSAERWNFNAALESVGFDPARTVTDAFRFTTDERQREREIGGDWERGFGDWSFKLVGLDTRRWYANDERTLFRDAAGAPDGDVIQLSRNEASETIGRISASWKASDAHRIEFGAETAFNALTTDLDLTIDGVPLVLPAANVTVEEERAEAFAAWSWKIDPRWSLESNLTVERSTISQSGDTNLSRTLTYWKPSLQLSRQIGERDQARVKVYRDVSQLDFGDFASSAQLLDDTVAAGNPDLQPQAVWRLEGVYDMRFGAKGAVTLTLGREWVQDASDLVPILDPGSGGFFDAPGNLGDADVWTTQLKGTLPIDTILRGAQFEFNLNWAQSEVLDPLTRRTRQLSGFAETEVSIDFRHDITAQKLAWGWSVYKRAETQSFRVAEVDTYEEGPFLDAFVETTRFGPAKIRLWAWNLLDTDFHRERVFSAPDRNGPVVREEERVRQFGRFVGVSVSGNF